MIAAVMLVLSLLLLGVGIETFAAGLVALRRALGELEARFNIRKCPMETRG